jgi:hypothetical protein
MNNTCQLYGLNKISENVRLVLLGRGDFQAARMEYLGYRFYVN